MNKFSTVLLAFFLSLVMDAGDYSFFFAAANSIPPNVHCDGNREELIFFNLEVAFDTRSSIFPRRYCNYQALGDDINRILLDHGIGSSGIGDGARYLGQVCRNPTTGRRRLGYLSLRPAAFKYEGGASCRQCPSDNFDHGRRDLQASTFLSVTTRGEGTSVTYGQNIYVGITENDGTTHTYTEQTTGTYAGAGSQTTSHSWFEGTYKPILTAALTSQIQQELIDSRDHYQCLGWRAQVVVTPVEVPRRDVNYGC